MQFLVCLDLTALCNVFSYFLILHEKKTVFRLWWYAIFSQRLAHLQTFAFKQSQMTVSQSRLKVKSHHSNLFLIRSSSLNFKSLFLLWWFEKSFHISFPRPSRHCSSVNLLKPNLCHNLKNFFLFRHNEVLLLYGFLQLLFTSLRFRNHNDII